MSGESRAEKPFYKRKRDSSLYYYVELHLNEEQSRKCQVLVDSVYANLQEAFKMGYLYTQVVVSPSFSNGFEVFECARRILEKDKVVIRVAGTDYDKNVGYDVIFNKN
jgi:hypothetical protein